jgi:hypothetical protein
MHCIVPLAGPQLTHPEGGLFARHPVEGMPLLRRTLETRPWRISGQIKGHDMVFVLREGPELTELRAAVQDWYPDSKTVVLSHLSRGALLSALAGTGAISALNDPLIIDLADIIYDCRADIAKIFAQSSKLAAIVPSFIADDPCFSYLRLGSDGSVIEAAEKRVISDHASAGTYIFRSLGDFLGACGNVLTTAPQELAFGDALFVCPVVNGLIRQGKRVMSLPVYDVRPVSKLLHDSAAA